MIRFRRTWITLYVSIALFLLCWTTQAIAQTAVTIDQTTAPTTQPYPVWTAPNDPNLSLNALLNGFFCGWIIWGTSRALGWMIQATRDAIE